MTPRLLRIPALFVAVGCGGLATSSGDSNLDAGASDGACSGQRDAAGEGEAGDSGDDAGLRPPSCAPGGRGRTNCGPGGHGGESCCTSLDVPGGTFERSYDGMTYSDKSYPATVSAFRLDRYETTVGRFRRFVDAVAGGWLPSAGSGKHTHLNGGKGLRATAGGYETGWDAMNWNRLLATTSSAWNTNLSCEGTSPTWTSSPGKNENKPISCMTWYEAYAFCIWDGGFLPSEAEWNFASSGGSEQRAYPWSAPYPPGSAAIHCKDATYAFCTAVVANDVGRESPSGDGRWGHSDLAGNVWEWNLDFYASLYVNPCRDCSNLETALSRVLRGGAFNYATMTLLASYRDYSAPSERDYDVGFRCARTP